MKSSLLEAVCSKDQLKKQCLQGCPASIRPGILINLHDCLRVYLVIVYHRRNECLLPDWPLFIVTPATHSQSFLLVVLQEETHIFIGEQIDITRKKKGGRQTSWSLPHDVYFQSLTHHIILRDQHTIDIISRTATWLASSAANMPLCSIVGLFVYTHTTHRDYFCIILSVV